jgi:hypothetical protein
MTAYILNGDHRCREGKLFLLCVKISNSISMRRSVTAELQSYSSVGTICNDLNSNKNLVHSLDGFHSTTILLLNTSIFWDIIPCRLLKDNQRFRGTHYTNLPGQTQARDQHELLVSCFMLVSYLAFLRTLRWR